MPTLYLDGSLVPQNGWVRFQGTAPAMVARALPIGAGVHYMIAADTFGATVHGTGAGDDDCAYAYPAGMCFEQPDVSISTVKPP